MMARSPSAISGWSAPHDPTRMKVGRSVIARISATDDLDVVRADAGGHDRDPLAPKGPRHRRELPMLVLELDGIEARADPGGSVGVAGEEDVLGQFAWAETDVVLPFSDRGRNPAIPEAVYAGIRVRQDRIPLSDGCFAGAKLGRG